MYAITKKLISAFLLATLVACSSLVVEPAQMAMGLDKTVGRPIESTERKTVLVTITDELHAQLSQGESIKQDGRLPPLYASFVAQMYRDYGLERIADWPLSSLDIRCLVFETDNAVTESLLEALRRHQFVETAQPMQYFSVSSGADDHAYDDPYYGLQSGYAAMQIPDSHTWATGKGVIVAVIDTGLDSRHLDLSKRIYGIRNFVDRSSRQFNADVHGTAVAGVIAANANNAMGIVGVAPEAQILGLKACRQYGPANRKAACNTFTLAKALDFAVNKRADIINLSLAGPMDPLLERLVQRAIDSDAIVVGARGNGADHTFPADVAGVIGVASSDATSRDIEVVVAPGNQVVSTIPGDEYDFFSGNSFATAHISGIVALIRQRKPHLQAAVILQLLSLTADNTTGYANACQALARIVGGDGCLAQEQTNKIAETRSQ